MSNNQFSVLDNIKITCQPISNKVSFKITTRKRHVYIDIVWPWIWNQCLYLWIWKNYRTKMIPLPSFQLASRLNSVNTNESDFINEPWHINLFMNMGISNLYNWISTSRKCFWLYFQSLHYYWPPSTWISLVHSSWGQMKRCEKRAFQLLKMRTKSAET